MEYFLFRMLFTILESKQIFFLPSRTVFDLSQKQFRINQVSEIITHNDYLLEVLQDFNSCTIPVFCGHNIRIQGF